MGIHYTYKSIRGEKAMKKEAKRAVKIEDKLKILTRGYQTRAQGICTYI